MYRPAQPIFRISCPKHRTDCIGGRGTAIAAPAADAMLRRRTGC
jgi:hypothetical protein